MTTMPRTSRVPLRLRHAATEAAGRLRGDQGTVAVEMAIGIPMLVLVVLLVAATYTMGRANLDVNAAASAGARAGSLARNANAATSAATNAARANLAGRCARLSIDVATGGFRRGGNVRVTVSCTVTTRGLTGIGLPGSATFKASATSPIDVYRYVSLGPVGGVQRPEDTGHA
ncbi:TadE family protein [Actinoplanes sp. ATCC 53533]|uniref:TadE/TadG family type IV pilus assembly protein n=1 Tax=Actinoplanes sp. ATCC 53533 TaxID=1288362 RepID=UPI000F7B958E|nr:TadE/TadG family type IV pilus assembly protein [Actinoplanes sp. ATCC 53533]RSM65120.1 TadE family protein [Actinoplanes sp. ATCC 53533]